MRSFAKYRASVRPADDAQLVRVDPKRMEFHSAEIRVARPRNIDRVAAPGWLSLEIVLPVARTAGFRAPQIWLPPPGRRIASGGWPAERNSPSHTVSVLPRTAPDVATRAIQKTACGLMKMPRRARVPLPQHRGL